MGENQNQNQSKKPKEKPEKKTKTEQVVIKYPAFSDVYVFEKQGDLIIPVRARYDKSNQMLITQDNKVYVVPEDYRPLLLFRKRWFRKQAVLVFLADPSRGVLVKWNESNIDVSVPNPKFIGTVLNSRLLEKLAGAVYFRLSDVVSWLLAGLGLAFILVFIVFPIIGIHISIGTQPIEVHPIIKVQPTSTPPPGNYTISK